jgi:hypothetical protein
VQFDLDENQSSLEIIHTDPSIWIKPTFRARRGKFPVNWLADMRKSLETAAEKQDGASRRDNVIPLIAYQLKLSDAQGELDQTLLDIESSPGKAVSDAKVKNDLQDLESMAISTTEMQTDTALSLTAFRSLLAEFEQVRSTNAAQKKYDSPLNDEKLWEQFGLKRQALKQACALLRQKLLRNL